MAVLINTSHLLQLIIILTSHDSNKATNSLAGQPKESGMEGLAHIFMDALAPSSGVELSQWPEEDALKYTLEWCVVLFLYLASIEYSRFIIMTLCWVQCHIINQSLVSSLSLSLSLSLSQKCAHLQLQPVKLVLRTY